MPWGWWQRARGVPAELQRVAPGRRTPLQNARAAAIGRLLHMPLGLPRLERAPQFSWCDESHFFDGARSAAGRV